MRKIVVFSISASFLRACYVDWTVVSRYKLAIFFSRSRSQTINMLSNLASAYLLVVALARAATLYLAGDSTMAANDGNDAIIGWGVFVGNYLSIPVRNMAVAGRSSRSYTDEGRCEYPLLYQLQLKIFIEMMQKSIPS